MKLKDRYYKLLEANPVSSCFAVLSKDISNKVLRIEMRKQDDGSLLWERKEKITNDYDFAYERMVFSSDGDKIAYTFENNCIICKSLNGEELIKVPVYSWCYDISNTVTGLGFCGNDDYIFVTLFDGTARKYKIGSEKGI